MKLELQIGNVASQPAGNNIQVTDAASSECTLSKHGDLSSNSGDLLSSPRDSISNSGDLPSDSKHLSSIPGDSVSNSGDLSSNCGDALSSSGDSSQPPASLNTPHCEFPF